jgi:hypothetical protein
VPRLQILAPTPPPKFGLSLVNGGLRKSFNLEYSSKKGGSQEKQLIRHLWQHFHAFQSGFELSDSEQLARCVTSKVSHLGARQAQSKPLTHLTESIVFDKLNSTANPAFIIRHFFAISSSSNYSSIAFRRKSCHANEHNPWRLTWPFLHRGGGLRPHRYTS